MLSAVGEGGKVMVRGEGRNEFGEINCEVVQGRIRLPLSHRRRCSRNDLGWGLISCLQFERLRLFEGRILQNGGARGAM
jgi:hypothetical protein